MFTHNDTQAMDLLAIDYYTAMYQSMAVEDALWDATKIGWQLAALHNTLIYEGIDLGDEILALTNAVLKARKDNGYIST